MESLNKNGVSITQIPGEDKCLQLRLNTFECACIILVNTVEINFIQIQSIHVN